MLLARLFQKHCLHCTQACAALLRLVLQGELQESWALWPQLRFLSMGYIGESIVSTLPTAWGAAGAFPVLHTLYIYGNPGVHGELLAGASCALLSATAGPHEPESSILRQQAQTEPTTNPSGVQQSCQRGSCTGCSVKFTNAHWQQQAPQRVLCAGTIPAYGSSATAMPNVGFLGFWENGLTGTLPASLGNLPLLGLFCDSNLLHGAH